MTSADKKSHVQSDISSLFCLLKFILFLSKCVLTPHCRQNALGKYKPDTHRSREGERPELLDCHFLSNKSFLYSSSPHMPILYPITWRLLCGFFPFISISNSARHTRQRRWKVKKTLQTGSKFITQERPLKMETCLNSLAMFQ